MKTLTLDEIARRFPERAIEVSRSGNTGTPPGVWRAKWYRYSDGYSSFFTGGTQDEALRALLAAELTKAIEYVDRARRDLAASEAHLRDREAVITELLGMASPEVGR